jgi:PAS domain S-box-containing protein
MTTPKPVNSRKPDRSQTSLLRIANNLPGIIYQLCWGIDASVTFPFISANCLRLLEREAAQIQADPDRLLSLIHAADRSQFYTTLDRASQTLTQWQWQGRLCLPSGQIQQTYWVAQPQPQSSGEIWWDGLLVEIDRPTKPPPSLLPDFAIDILNSISAPIFVKDSQHRWVFLNDAYCEFVGYSREELLGKTNHDFFPKDQADLCRQQDEHVLEADFTPESEEYITRSAGDTRLVSIQKTRLSDRDGNLFLVGILRDITAARQAELQLRDSQQLLQLVIHNIPQLVVWKDRNSVFLGCNQSAAMAAGLSETSQIVGKTDYDLPWTPEETDWYLECDRRVMSSGNPELHILETQRQADGRQAWLETNKIPLRDSAGDVMGILVTIEDITERKQTEQRLNLQYAASQVLATSQNLAEAIPMLLQALCETLEWELGEFWQLDPQTAKLRCVQNWHSEQLDVRELEAVTQALAFGIGEGLPGRTWQSAAPIWMTEIANEPHFHRRSIATEMGLYSALGFPILSDRTLGVITLFSRHIHPVDSTLLQVLAAIGNQLGGFIERKQMEVSLYEAYEDLEDRVEQRTAQLMQINQRLKREIAERQLAEEALQASERQYRNLVETSQDLIWSVDAEGRLTFVNQAVRQIYGYEPEEMLGRLFSDFYPAELIEMAAESLHEPDRDCFHPARRGESVCQYEVVQLRKDGTPITLVVNAIALYDEAGRIVGTTGTATNITDRKRAELLLQEKNRALKQALRELQHTQAQLIQSEKMSGLGQLVAGVAHEINNPVNFIYGNLAHAQEYINNLLELVELYQVHYPDPPDPIATRVDEIELDFLVEDLPNLLQSMQVGADRIQEIVASLRTFSRMDEAEVKVVDIHPGIDSTLTILQHKLKPQSKGFGRSPWSEIAVIKHYGILPPVECYPGQLNQVFMNILANAIDALELRFANNSYCTGAIEEAPQIHIWTQVVASHAIEIRISDNGSGMNEATRSRLFDPFFTTKPVGKGTGMGLSISYQIVVDRHRGSLQCDSELGRGAVFTISIPLRQTGDRDRRI